MQKLITLTLLILAIFAITPLSWGHPQFTDETFQKLVSEQRTGIIYLWSPFMPLSVIGREEILQVASELNVPATRILDPLADSTSVTDPIMASGKLSSFGMLDHFPALMIYKNGHLVENVLVQGYEPPQKLISLLKSFFEQENLCASFP